MNNLISADVYFGRGQTILLQRERLKRKTIDKRRLQHRKPQPNKMTIQMRQNRR